MPRMNPVTSSVQPDPATPSVQPDNLKREAGFLRCIEPGGLEEPPRVDGSGTQGNMKNPCDKRPVIEEFCALPDGVLERICKLLDYKSMKQLSQVNRETHTIVRNQPPPNEIIKINNSQELKIYATLFPTMTRLDASKANLSDEDVRFIAENLPKLTTLNLAWNSDVTDESVIALSGMPSLQELNLAATGVTDEGLKALSGMSSLERLDLGAATGVGDEGAIALSKMSSLKGLTLAMTPRVGDEGATALSSMTSLERLNVMHCNVTDVGRQAIIYNGWSRNPSQDIFSSNVRS